MQQRSWLLASYEHHVGIMTIVQLYCMILGYQVSLSSRLRIGLGSHASELVLLHCPLHVRAVHLAVVVLRPQQVRVLPTTSKNVF